MAHKTILCHRTTLLCSATVPSKACIRGRGPCATGLDGGRAATLRRPTPQGPRTGLLWGSTLATAPASQARPDNHLGLPPSWKAQAASLAGCMVSISTMYCIPFFVLMVAAPHLKWVRDIVKTPWFIAPIAAVYLVLLLQSWEPDTISLMMPGNLQEGMATGKPQFFPELSGISTLFSRAVTAASLWVHLLTINLFTARHVFLDGFSCGVPTRHSVFFSSVVGPLGLLSHILTKVFVFALRPRASGSQTTQSSAA
mmetsp:Transcript_85/g.265  ORF Transcript_85/g.265 Transcript_85/m.265 type:complete len:255 (-) Transcript_85:56-820(-)